MAVKIRLQRRGRKKLAIFDIVVADSRSPRDGKIIEKIGTYNPNHNPASIVLNNEKLISSSELISTLSILSLIINFFLFVLE